MRTAETILKEKEKGTVIISIPGNTTVHEALKVMLERRIGAIMVKEGDKYVGIWTERDLMTNTVTEGFDPRTAQIKDTMVTGLLSVPHTASVNQILDKFLGKRLRHLLIEQDGEYIGLISIGDVIKADLLDKTEEVKDLSSKLNWEYYENWSPRKK